LRQVDAIAPLLFSAVLEIAVGRYKVKIRKKKYLTNVVKLWHALVMWLLWEKE